MIKVLNQYFPGRLFVLLFTENLLILLGIWAAVSYWTGGHLETTLPVLFAKCIAITAVCQLCFYYADIYDLRSMTSRMEVFFRLMQALGAACLILAVLFTIFPDFRLGKRVVESSILGIILMILIWRLLVEWLQRTYGGGERVLLVGSGNAVLALCSEIEKRPDLPFNVVGVVGEAGEDRRMLPNVPHIGLLAELENAIAESKPDRIVIALKERRQQLPLDLLLKTRMRGVLIEEGSSTYQKVAGRIPVESINPSSLIFSEGFEQSAFRRAYARVFGFLGSILCLVLCGPLMVLIAIAIKLDSRGPILYRQERTGKNGAPFQIMKFRSMRIDAESSSGPVWAQKDDPRITRVGRLLRKLRFDELPQFLNVLYGQMGFVGPRPERPHFVQQLAESIPFYDLRHSVRPGITGWAQVSCDYGATIEESSQKLEYDLFYIKNVSFSFDLMILFQTIKIVIFGRGAR